MRTRKEVIEFCMSLKQVYEDYPFQDSNWTLMRHETNKKTFAFIFEPDSYDKDKPAGPIPSSSALRPESKEAHNR